MTGPSPDSFHPVPECELPVFKQAREHYCLFYAPGYLVVVDNGQRVDFEADLRRGKSQRWPVIEILRDHARHAISTWNKTLTRPYEPICLTLYLNNECNLGCGYCYSNPTPRPAPRLELATIQAGAELVAQNCRARTCSFTTVFHGGGEPTLHQDQVNAALDAIEDTAARYGLSLFRYIATNGVMAPAKARWVARRFDLIGLSCDGPDTIQNQQRPLWGEGQSSLHVERTATIVHDMGKPLHVRVTVTPENMRRQVEIADYVCRVLQPEEIHVEPVYRGGRATAANCFETEQAEGFVSAFIEARAVAHRYGIPWLMSGSRPGEIHGPYCNIFRDVLNLVPGGVATACFKTTTAARTRAAGVMVGAVADGRLLSDYDHIQSLRRSLRAYPPKCETCFNQYHCVRDCPDHCPLEGLMPSNEFGCRFQKTYVYYILHEMAESLYATHNSATDVIGAEVRIS